MSQYENYLSESGNFKVYSLDESVYLKDKNSNSKPNEYDKRDLSIAYHYGEPEGAMISPTEDYVVVVGHGISIYPLNQKYGIESVELFNDPNSQMWTNGIHIESYDQPDDSWETGGPYWLWFRFVSIEDDKTCVFKMNAKTHELLKVD